MKTQPELVWPAREALVGHPDGPWESHGRSEEIGGT